MFFRVTKQVPIYKRAVFFILVLLFPFSLLAQTGSISGVVQSQMTGNVLPGANVSMHGFNMGGATNEAGEYLIEAVPVGNYKIKVSFIGYQTIQTEITVVADETAKLDFKLKEKTLIGETIVISASRRPEKLTDAPATISVVDAEEVSRTVSFNYSEALRRTKGVDVYRSGINSFDISTRGFMSAYSYRTQLVADGRNSTMIGAGLAANIFLPVTREDIERIEVVQGAGAGLYGPNASNGLVNIVTKHPRDYPGTTIVIGGGENDIVFSRFRRARVFNEKFAYKINVENLRGTDFVKNDLAAVVNDTRFFEDPNSNIKSLRTDGSFYWSLGKDMEVIASAGFSENTATRTVNSGRNQYQDWKYEYQQLRFSSQRFFAQAYRTGNHAGDSYTIETRIRTESNASPPITREEAIKQASFVDESRRYNLEAQYNTTVSGFHLIGGGSYEDNRPVSKGTFLPDTAGRDISIKQAGFYGQVEREVGRHWKFVGAGRFDTQDNYNSQFSPRAAVLYKLPGHGAFRLTYHRAFQAPAILQQELLLDFGSLLLLGNGQGFKFSDGSEINRLEPETNDTFEFGYKGQITSKLFFDVNGYIARYENFISPLTSIGSTNGGSGAAPFIVSQGDTKLADTLAIRSYLNFGKVDVRGFDVALKYQVTPKVGLWFNFSHIDPKDIDDAVNQDARFGQLSFNTTENKYNFGFWLSDIFTNGTYAALSMRHVDEYDFISGSHSATKARSGTGTFQFTDRGPLGGFNTVDLTLSHLLKDGLQFSVSVTNLLNESAREMVGSPEIRRLTTGEVKYHF